jgi:hypothetical protein
MSALSRLSRDAYKVSKAARIANAYQRGGVPAVGKQYVRRVAHRKLIGLLRRGGLW